MVAFLFLDAVGRAEDIQFPPGAFGIAPSPYGAWAMVNVKSAPYNAAGDGVTDDTAAIQSAINAVGFGIIYLPSGTYRITAPLTWTVNGQDVPNRSLQGEGVDQTFIQLDNAAAGFGNASAPQAVIQTRGEWWETSQSETATAFNNSLYSLTINTGSNNPGAVGVSWMVSNQGTIRDVAIVSGDGQGVAGVNYLGESGGLMENVTITGFQYGIQGANGGYATLTADGLNLSGQTVAGLRPDNDVFFIGDLTSNSNVPALLTENWASRAVLDGAMIYGGNSSEGAITYGGGNLFLRNIVTSSSSYGASLNYLSNGSYDLRTDSGIPEWSSNAINVLFPAYTSGVSMNLPRAPVDPGFHTNDFSQWANVTTYYLTGDGSDWSPAFQRAIDSGAQIVYFPPSANNYTLGETVHIRDNVREITGLRSANLSRLSGYSTTPSMEFDDNNNGGASVVIEQFRSWSDIVVNTTMPVVIRDMSTPTETGVVSNAAGVAANVTIDGLTGYAAFTSNTWATIRALDPEYPPAGTACIYNNDSIVAMLGAKNEGVANLCDNEGGGKSDLLGYYSSPFATPGSTDIAFTNNASSLFTFAFPRIGTPSYSAWVQETQNGTTLTGSQGSLTPGYAGYVPIPFTTNFEPGSIAPTWNDSPDSTYTVSPNNVVGYYSYINPECSIRTNEVAHSGSSALMYSGTALGAPTDYCYYKVFSVNIPVTSSSQLSYWIYPQMDNGRYVAVDFICSDGSDLRDSGAVDQNGYSVHPAAGHGGNIPINAWSEIVTNFGQKLAGKTIVEILVGFDRRGYSGGYRGYIDDITINN